MVSFLYTGKETQNMKRSELFFNAVLVPVDYLMLVFAAIAAYAIRFETGFKSIRPVFYDLPFNEFLLGVIGVAFLFIVVFTFSGLYAMKGTRRMTDELARIIFSVSTGYLIIIVLIFFQRELFSSRFIIIGSWGLAIIFVLLGRWLVLRMQRSLFSRGIGVHRVALIGVGRGADTLEEVIKREKTFGLVIVARIKNVSEDTLRILRNHAEAGSLDEIIVADPTVHYKISTRLLAIADQTHVTFRYTADLFDAKAQQVVINPIAGIPIVEIQRTPLEGWGKVAKRLMDIVGSSILILLTSPLMIATAIAIKIESGSPVIFFNERVGRARKHFLTYKFRTMKTEHCIGPQFTKEHNKAALALEEGLIESQSVKKGALYKIKDDPRVSPLGEFLRRSSLDELLQFFNVLQGRMSLIGPRPHQPREVARYTMEQRKILSIKPGVTGLSQITGRDLSFNEEARLELHYIENWSLWRDLYILFKTPLVLFRKREAA